MFLLPEAKVHSVLNLDLLPVTKEGWEDYQPSR